MKDNADNLYWESEICKCNDIIADSAAQIERYKQKIAFHEERIKQYLACKISLEKNLVND